MAINFLSNAAAANIMDGKCHFVGLGIGSL